MARCGLIIVISLNRNKLVRRSKHELEHMMPGPTIKKNQSYNRIGDIFIRMAVD
jgi:hypothetical protein